MQQTILLWYSRLICNTRKEKQVSNLLDDRCCDESLACSAPKWVEDVYICFAVSAHLSILCTVSGLENGWYSLKSFIGAQSIHLLKLGARKETEGVEFGRGPDNYINPVSALHTNQRLKT